MKNNDYYNYAYVTKEVTWDMAHRLDGYNGPCRNLHGHTYKLQVTLSGRADASTGFVMDFNELKGVLDKIKSRFDHKCVLDGNSKDDAIIANALRETGCEFVMLAYKPTAENMARDIYDTIARDFPGLVVESVKLWETPTSFAEVIG